MKKLLLSSIVLFLFSIAMILFQFSCKKEAQAQTSTTGTSNSELNLILFSKNTGGGAELWLSNTDGSNQRKIPINLPTGLTIDNAYLSADGQKVFFDVDSPTQKGAYMYSCSIDGGNLTKIIGDSNQDAEYGLEDVK